ncbi:MAG: divergent PAP2 family protein [Snowella sp.]
MQELGNIFQNQALAASIAACLIAQALKAIIDIVRNGKINIRTLFSTGGMPSAHSALVGALATSIGLQMGWNSNEAAIASLLAAIVMYDAAGVRQAAGKQARILNQIIDELFQEGHTLNEERLKELLGHTPTQVFVGLALGMAIAFLFFRPL